MHSDALSSAMHTATGDVTTIGGTALAGHVRIKGAYYVASVAGSITLRSGGASGTIVTTIPIAAGSDMLCIPEEGLLFRSGVHMTVTAATITGITFFYC